MVTLQFASPTEFSPACAAQICSLPTCLKHSQTPTHVSDMNGVQTKKSVIEFSSWTMPQKVMAIL